MMRLVLAILILAFACQLVLAQQTNPVDRKVTNPMTDTPNVNPLNQDQPVTASSTNAAAPRRAEANG